MADKESRWIYSVVGIGVLLALAALVFGVIALIWAFAPAFST